jgi:glycosyltransferase involved in cell wall biosynthesis
VNQARSIRTHRRARPDVLHVIDAPIPFLAPCPVVVTVHDLMTEVYPEDYPWIANRSYRRWRWLHRRRAARLLAISRTTAADIQRFWGVAPERIDVVHHGTVSFPPARFEETWEDTLASRFPDLKGARFVLAPYNLEPRKNLGTLLDAFHAVRRRMPDVTLVLFGKAAWNTEREAAYDARIAALGLTSVVTRLGVVGDAELAALYRAADVFAFPALYEGFGLPLLEAMACGGCVLARDASAMAEVVGDAGLLVETSDRDALAAGLGRLLGDDAARARLRVAARARAATFTAARMARETAAVYRRAAGAA